MTLLRGLCLCAALSFSLGLPGRLAAAPPWLKVETPDVRIYSDGGQRSVREFAVNYTAFRRIFDALMTEKGRPPLPATVILFRRSASLRRYLSNKDSADRMGYAFAVGAREIFALAFSGDDTATIPFALELDSETMLKGLGYRLPLWMLQGASEVFSSMTLNRHDVEIGEEQERFTEPLRRVDLIPWNEFFVMTAQSEKYRGKEGEFTGIYQAQAWALMKAVLLEGNAPRERFIRLAAKVHGVESDQDAVATLLGVDRDRLDQIVARMRSTGSYKLPFDVVKVRASVPMVPAPNFEVEVQIGGLLISGGRWGEGDYLVDEAEKLAPEAVCVKEALGRRAVRGGNLMAAAREFRVAIAKGSVDAQAYFVSGEQRLNDASLGGGENVGGGGQEAVQAVLELRRGLELTSIDMGGYCLLARAHLIAPSVTEADVADLAPGLDNATEGPFVLFYRAQIYKRLGRIDKCVSDLHAVLAGWGRPELKASARRMLDRVEMH